MNLPVLPIFSFVVHNKKSLLLPLVLLLLNTIFGCRSQADVTTGTCTLIKYDSTEHQCTWTAWEYPTYRVVRTLKIEKATHKVLSIMVDSSFSYTESGKEYHATYSTYRNDYGSVDSVWVFDILHSDSTPHAYYNVAYQYYKPQGYLLKTKIYQFKEGKDGSIHYANWYDKGVLVDSNVYQTQQNEHISHTYDAQGRLKRFSRRDSVGNTTCREKYSLFRFNAPFANDNYGLWIDSIDQRPELLNYSRQCGDGHMSTMLLEFSSSVDEQQWLLDNTRALYDRYAPYARPLLNSAFTRVELFLSAPDQVCAFRMSNSEKQSTLTSIGSCDVQDAYARLLFEFY